jgi:hypothetical protein
MLSDTDENGTSRPSTINTPSLPVSVLFAMIMR